MLELVVPGILAGVACYGMAKGVDVYDALLVGAGKGLEILLKILPALVTLLTVVAMLRASGGLEVLADVLAPVLGWLGIPPETVGIFVVRPCRGRAGREWGGGGWALPRRRFIPSPSISARRASGRAATQSRRRCVRTRRGSFLRR